MARSRRNAVLRVGLGALAVLAIWLAGRDIVAQWMQFRATGATISPDRGLLSLSALMVLASYAVLIETWRRTVSAWGQHLRWKDAARIWFISNLGRYLPGKVWQLGAMSAMAHHRGVSPVAAAGSALVVNLVNLLAGVGVVAVCGAEVLQERGAAILFAALLAAAIAATPWILPLVGRLAAAIRRRPVELPPLPHRALWLAAIGCVAAWVLYGIAFQTFVHAVLGAAPGPLARYIAVFTGSYLVGYIAVFAPGGIGVREKSLVMALGSLPLALGAPGVVAVTSRLWLTVLEVLPGVCLLAVDAIRRVPSSAREDGKTH